MKKTTRRAHTLAETQKSKINSGPFHFQRDVCFDFKRKKAKFQGDNNNQ